MRYLAVLLILVLLLSVSKADAMTLPQSGYFVASYGSPGGDGSPERPFDLATVLGASSPLQPGQTAWLAAGEYTGNYVTHIAGTTNQPVTIRGLRGAKLDGSIETWGAWITIRDLEIYDSDLKRVSVYVGSNPADITGKDALTVYGEHTRLINNIIHDVRQGVGFWSTALDSELYGNIIYNVGWQGPDRGHGHAVYVQNRDATRPKTLEHNIFVSSFAPNVIAVYGSPSAYVYGVQLLGNVTEGREVLIQGDGATVVESNHFYLSPTTIQGRSNRNPSPDVTVTGNYISSFKPNFHALNFDNWTGATVRDNQITAGDYASPSLVAFSTLPPGRAYDWDANRYYYRVGAQYQTFRWHGVAFYNWAAWQALGYDASGTYTPGLPPDSVHVTANRYEPGRGHIVVYNWTRQNTVNVDLSPLALTIGRPYRLRVAQDYADSVTEFVYTGAPLTVSMSGYPVALPNGYATAIVPSTFPDFGVFLVEPAN